MGSYQCLLDLTVQLLPCIQDLLIICMFFDANKIDEWMNEWMNEWKASFACSLQPRMQDIMPHGIMHPHRMPSYKIPRVNCSHSDKEQ